MSLLRNTARRSIHRHLLVGLALAAILTTGVGGWSATVPISGAVIAGGAVVVDSHVKQVQHAIGGVVGDLHARNGMRVAAGHVLIRLDDTQTKAKLAIIEKRLDALGARKARLTAEREANQIIDFPTSLQARAKREAAALELIRGEQRLFEKRMNARDGRKKQLGERIAQLEQEIEGMRAQILAKTREIELIGHELEGVRSLYKQGLSPITRLNALDRETARLAGERGALSANIAKAQRQIVETRMQIVQIDEALQSEVAQEISDVEMQIGEFEERRIAVEDEMHKLEIRSPQSGVVHALAVHAPGAVIRAGDPVMTIVPDSDELVVEVRVPPTDIDQLAIDRQAVLRFSAFNQRTTPEVIGSIARIGPDLTRETSTNLHYYSVRIKISPEEMARLGTLKLVPGMPVEAFIQTGDRTALTYLLKPLSDNIERAFREG